VGLDLHIKRCACFVCDAGEFDHGEKKEVGVRLMDG
jgi:hypothetical protein